MIALFRAFLFGDWSLWLELFLSAWLACALLYRMAVVLYPDFEFPLLATSSPLHTSIAEINVVVIWILLGIVFLSGIRRMSAVLSELGAFKQFVWMLVRNLLTLSPLFLLYDFWLIEFIYTTWTSKFLVVFQTLQLFPSAGLLAHSVYQHCFISTMKRNMCSRHNNVNVGCMAVVNAAVNLVMLLHLLCTFVVLFVTQPSQLLDTTWLMVLELLFRVVGLAAFLHMFVQQPGHHCMTESERSETESKRSETESERAETKRAEIESEYNNSETALTYAVEFCSLLNKQAHYEALSHCSQSLPPLEDHEIVPKQVRDGNSQSSSLVVPKPSLHTKAHPEQSCLCM